MIKRKPQPLSTTNNSHLQVLIISLWITLRADSVLTTDSPVCKRDGGGVGDTLTQSIWDVDRNISCMDTRPARENERRRFG